MKSMGEIIEMIDKLDAMRSKAEEYHEWASLAIINDKISLLKWVLD